MSLARQLMSGVTLEGIEINPNRYTYDEGAFNIAVESAAELHEIFKESFYDMEQIELAAIHEGVEVVGSQFQPLMESKVSGIFEKVKSFLLKLKEKVKSFLHAIKRQFDSMIKSGKDFAAKYKSDIEKLSFKDYKIKIFEYDDKLIDGISLDATTAFAEDISTQLMKEIDKKLQAILKFDDFDDKATDKQTIAAIKKAANVTSDILTDRDKVIEIATKTLAGKPLDMDEFGKWAFAIFRKGAESESDIDEREITDKDVRDMMTVLINSKTSSKVDEIVTKTDKIYVKAIKSIDDIKKKIERMKDVDSDFTSGVTSSLNDFSTAISVTQSVMNKYTNAWKTAVSSRDRDYKKVIIGAFSYARSYNRKNK